VYALDEVVVEKLRAFLQTAVNLDRRDWTNRARDLYDLWWLHENHAPVAWAELRGPLDVKAAARGVAFTGSADFLDPRVLRSHRDSWNVRLANVVPNPRATRMPSTLRISHVTSCEKPVGSVSAPFRAASLWPSGRSSTHGAEFRAAPGTASSQAMSTIRFIAAGSRASLAYVSSPVRSTTARRTHTSIGCTR